jgi:hypothetical protein
MRVFQFFIPVFCALFFVNFSSGQPQQETKKMVKGVTVYKDAKNPRLYYYEPGKLIMARTGDGKPDFQFLDLRYTGTKCRDDIGTKNFMSLVQFGIEMQKTAPEILKQVKRALGNVNLKPLPISAIATRLILPRATTEDNTYQPIGTAGTTEAASAKGYNTATAYWSKRYFTTRLSSYESQILNQQLTDGQLGLTLSYSYYVKMIPFTEEMARGSEELTGIIEKPDSTAQEEKLKNILINSNALSIEVDVEKYPDAIKQIDLNEGIPPSYAAIEIKCYDFSKDLRPDLYMKIVEIEAISVDKNKPVSVTVRFTKQDTDIYTRYIKFPYAVQMDKAMRYRISEISMKGEQQVFEWIDKPECTSVIDISTKEKDQKTETFAIDVEIDQELFANENLTSLEVQFSYILNGKPEKQAAIFDTDEMALKTLIFERDKNTSIVYKTILNLANEERQEGEEQSVTDMYVYVNAL